ncbi:MAG: rRNA synthase [Thermoleophilaceae bacterium]|nr:rRNA synthase [Thermoleophilaceae bacterium]
MSRIELTAGPEQDGQRLDVALAAHPDVGSRAAAQKLLDAGAVTVDGRARPKRHRLSPGERVEAEAPEVVVVDPGEAGADVAFGVAYEDEHLLVVDKPAGVVVHPAPGHEVGTLAQALASRGAAGGADAWRPGIVHRLDRDTSGLMVVAKSDAVHRALQELIRRREMRREYLALVSGRPDARSGTIDAPIGRDRRDRTAHSTSTDRPREAVTHFEIEQAFPRTTLLRVHLETGRTHQIRVHLAAIGHPVCGDAQYGGAACGRGLGLTRQYLHAAKLVFMHPITGGLVLCESNLPVDLHHASEAAAREPVSDGPDGD